MQDVLIRSPIGIGAGLIKSRHQDPYKIYGLLDHVTFGSYTKDPRQGNKEPTYWFDEANRTSINAVGLTNPGIKHFVSYELRALISARHDCKLRVSLAPLQPGDIETIFADHADIFRHGYIDEFEINAACPNHRDASGSLHPVLCCDSDALDALMAEAGGYTGRKAIKIAPDMTVEALREVVKLARKHGFSSIVSGNTRKSSSTIDGTKRLSVDQGGMAGAVLLDAGLAQVRTLRQIITEHTRSSDPHLRLIGCGGVMSAHDLAAYLTAGADVVQCVTYFAEYGEKGIQDLMSVFASVD